MRTQWFLEGYLGTAAGRERIALRALPFRVGRDEASALPLPHSEVSRQHAEFFEREGGLWLRDLGSTNGTFVNREPLRGDCCLRHGDVLHFASIELRILRADEETSQFADVTQFRDAVPLSSRLPPGLAHLDEVLARGLVGQCYQPIVDCFGDLHGYELLGRGAHEALPAAPGPLFQLAESMSGKAADLSSLMRRRGVADAAANGLNVPVFVNTHPEELSSPAVLLAEMAALRARFPQLRLVLEIHENTVTDLSELKRFVAALRQMNVELAYDDFGAGQARLREMVEVPVAYIKFDIALIRGIHEGPPHRLTLLKALVSLAKDMGVITLAEGVEGEGEFRACKELGFDLLQGYFFGRPSLYPNYQNPWGH